MPKPLFHFLSAARPVAIVARARPEFKVVPRPKVRRFERSSECHQSEGALLWIIRANQRRDHSQSLANRCVSAGKMERKEGSKYFGRFVRILIEILRLRNFQNQCDAALEQCWVIS